MQNRKRWGKIFESSKMKKKKKKETVMEQCGKKGKTGECPKAKFENQIE